MSKKEIKTYKYSCDVCDSEVTKDDLITHMEIPFSYGIDTVNKIKIGIAVSIPYGTEAGDVCKKCLIKYLKEWIKTNENN